jgi:hypothetical protein
MASEYEEIAALDRVLTRTVLTKDDDLQQVGRQRFAEPYRTSMCLIGMLILCRHGIRYLDCSGSCFAAVPRHHELHSSSVLLLLHLFACATAALACVWRRV